MGTSDDHDCISVGFPASTSAAPRESDCLLSITNDSSDSRSFKTDTKRRNLEVGPVTGPEADALIKQVYATSPDIVKLASEYMKEAQ